MKILMPFLFILCINRKLIIGLDTKKKPLSFLRGLFQSLDELFTRVCDRRSGAGPSGRDRGRYGLDTVCGDAELPRCNLPV
jgi:hypothetical protein